MMEAEHIIGEHVLQNAQEGDQEAFEEIFEAFLAPIYRFVLFRIDDIENAEKLTEEIFLTIWKRIKRFKKDGKAPFAVWVFQIAHKKIVNFLERVKKTSPERQQFLEESKRKKREELERISFEEQEKSMLSRALAKTPSSQAEAVILKYFCGLTNEDIGMILEKTSGAVRILQSRGLKKLREAFEEEGQVT